MKILKNKKLILVLLLFFIILVLLLAINYGKSQITTDQEHIETALKQDSAPSFEVDFDGDGIKETIKIITSDNGQTILEAYNKQGEKIAAIPQERPIPAPLSYKAIKLNLNSNKEYIQWNRTAGAHQMETVFLTMNGNEILPIYGIDDGIFYRLFVESQYSEVFRQPCSPAKYSPRHP